MFGNKGATANARKANIRRETVLVPIASNGPSKSAPSATSRPPPGDRFKLSQRANVKSGGQAHQSPPVAARRALAPSRGLKRKATPQSPHFSSDDEDDDSDHGASDSDASRKRMKSSVSSVESAGPRRNLVLDKAFDVELGKKRIRFIRGADATSGEFVAKFKNPWNQDEFEKVELQYPAYGQRELFELKWPKNDKEDYKPMEDIIETVKQICLFYLPENLRDRYTNEDTGFGRRFNRAWVRQSIPDFINVVQDFNAMLQPLVEDGTIKRELGDRRHLPLDTVRRLLDQIYARTVSPKVESLRAYQNGSDNVYGELLARFCSEIFSKTRLNHESVFIDLGSGVGNVVLQAALEKGCDSWGVEMMKNPCDLADLQAKEFPARSRLWGIRSGAVKLLRGDFTDTPEIAQVLQRADVVLVNNQAFTPALNNKLCNMFLDLKNGCQVVSLKPFVPEGHKMSVRNVGSVVNLFVQRRFEYFSGSVSWTDQSGYYYIAEKDPRPLEKFMKNIRS